MKLFVLAALAFAACSSHGVAPAQAAGARPVPRAVDVAGLHDVLRAQRGHPVVLNFWASWCGPCMQEFPDLVKGARTWRSRGVRFVSVSADDPHDLPKVQKVLERFGAPFDAVLIASAKAGTAIIDDVDPDWSGALPTTFLYDPNGKRIARRIGPIDEAGLRKWLVPILK